MKLSDLERWYEQASGLKAAYQQQTAFRDVLRVEGTAATITAGGQTLPIRNATAITAATSEIDKTVTDMRALSPPLEPDPTATGITLDLQKAA